MPQELRTVTALELLSQLTPVAIEAAYQAILARAGRKFAENSLLMMMLLMLDLPAWLKQKFDLGDLNYQGGTHGR